MDNLQRYLQMAMDWAIVFVPKVFLAIIIFWIGIRLINKLNILTNRSLAMRNIDATIRPFFASMVDVSLRIILFLIIAGIFGFEISSIIALLGALAFTVGLALQGSLGHFASGILLLILKPYKIGDEIKVADAEGFVEEVQVFNTIIRTRDNRFITVPNGLVTSGNIINYTGQGNRRVDMTFIVDEPNPVSKVKKVIVDSAAKCPLILQDPPMELFLEHFDCDELHFAVRPWCKAEDYWQVWAFMQETIKTGFDVAELKDNIHYHQMVQDRNDLQESRRQS